jgi:hypothetical protein
MASFIQVLRSIQSTALGNIKSRQRAYEGAGGGY